MDLGERIKAEREKRGWSVYRLAKGSRVSQDTIARIEKGIGKPSLLVRLALAEILSLNPETFEPLE